MVAFIVPTPNGLWRGLTIILCLFAILGGLLRGHLYVLSLFGLGTRLRYRRVSYDVLCAYYVLYNVLRLINTIDTICVSFMDLLRDNILLVFVGCLFCYAFLLGV